jgi:hypothetical protein
MKRRHFLTLTGISASVTIGYSTAILASKNSQILTGRGKFTFIPNPEKNHEAIDVWTYQPENLQSNSRVVIVIPGHTRDGKGYRDAWLPYSQQHKFLLLVPEFPADRYPGDAYNEGNILNSQGHPIPQSEWTFTIVEKLFDYAKKITGNQSQKYYLFGHSAGGQFVHRFVLFMSQARYQRAIAANPGFYTFPTSDIRYPYGLKGTSLQNGIAPKIFERDFILMLGELDTNPNDPVLRKTPQAEAQGSTRFERGNNYFQANLKVAQREQASFNWHLVLVPGAGHSDKQMAHPAAEVLFKKNLES